MKKSFYKNYWDKNLVNWTNQYINLTKKNEENFRTNFFVKFLYKNIIYNLELKSTKDRLKISQKFLEEHKSIKKVLNDIGAGNGFVTKKFIKKFKKINYIDFSKEAINSLKKIKGSKKIYYIDKIKQQMPRSDLAICLGVTPYIEKKFQIKFLNNIVSNTKIALIHYLDKNNFFNLVRIIIPTLNVRKVNVYSKDFLDNYYKKIKFILKKRIYFGTGFCDIISKYNIKI